MKQAVAFAVALGAAAWVVSSAASSQAQAAALVDEAGATQVFAEQIHAILVANCSGCHHNARNANFVVSSVRETYDSLLRATARDGRSRYVVAGDVDASLLYQRIASGSAGWRMPRFGVDLTLTDTDTPPDGYFDAAEIEAWIRAGAEGP